LVVGADFPEVRCLPTERQRMSCDRGDFSMAAR
jgi:hypothetical protein